VDFRNADSDRFASALIERGTCPAQKSVKIIATGHPILYFKRRAISIFTHLDEGNKKIQNAVAQLLHIGMLVGRAFVAINGNALMNNFSIEILFFSQRLHHKLLQIFAEQGESILVWQDHHVFLSATVT